jgi:type I restriction enzyme M protein
MLTQETKRHIDAARQVLVGVVPNPSSQIEQITNALIYKFMDDMDQSAIKAGGDPSFFVGSLERYAWTRLMDSRLGNQERMNLYSEALVKFSEAKQLPSLFRDIFKSAFLPYRSPEVLGLFLKEIDYFDYSHSEELGNAYEYLLSIMGSQGDAGQFRTPRHIIDFIVAAVNPTKDDKVLDPACGTSGFLVSAYKHILEQHDGKNPDGSKNDEKPLTPDQRRKLMDNFEGYDVDPGMVRISQVNLYLHHFKNPRIFSYNTLTDDERWKDNFDVILANPPFMSPKGGVPRHNKFGIPSNRSEVLFVDYFITHLRPKGRAGMIVPEGIIFQSATAHTTLRKKLVEDGLYAVVSLPSGVFQPYSGVKTSILFFDNERASQNAEILFIKVENDGFDLGAQRRKIDKNDLPQALEILKKWKNGKKVENKLAVYVKREDIAGSEAYSLSGDRYKVATDYSNAKWPMVKLGEVLDYEQPTNYIVKSVDYNDKFPTPVLTAGKSFILGYTNEKEGIFHDGLPVIIFDDFTTATKFVDFSFKVKSSAMKILHARKEVANIRYVFYLMQNIDFSYSEHKRFWISEYSKIKIPLPPLEIQQQIVVELDGYQNIISGSRQAAENWKPKIEIDPKWKKVKLGEVCDFVRGPFGGSLKKEIFVTDGYAVYEQSHAIYENFTDFRYFIEEGKFREMKRFEVKSNDLIMSCSGTMGKTAIVPSGSRKGIINQALLKLTPHEGLDVKFLKLWMDSSDFQKQLLSKVSGAAIQNVASVKVLQDLNVLLPPLEIQKQIAQEIEAERALVDSAKKLIGIYEQKTKDVIAKLWSE